VAVRIFWAVLETHWPQPAKRAFDFMLTEPRAEACFPNGPRHDSLGAEIKTQDFWIFLTVLPADVLIAGGM